MNILRSFGLEFIEDVKRLAPTLFWREGLRNTGYLTCSAIDCLEFEPFRQKCLTILPPDPYFIDCILLRYPIGANIPLHTDLQRESNEWHTRMLVLIQAAEMGGQLFVDEQHIALSAGDAISFEVSAIQHHVTEVLAGERLVFSVGVWNRH